LRIQDIAHVVDTLAHFIQRNSFQDLLQQAPGNDAQYEASARKRRK
jgi:hypothetical protein